MTTVGHNMGFTFPRHGVQASRIRVPWTRAAANGALLLILGAWAAIVPFIGPYLNFAYTPATNTAWHWTAARGWLEVAPGVAAAVAGLLLVASTYRIRSMAASWLAIAAGAWLIVGPSLTSVLHQHLGSPDPASSTGVRALEQLFFFYAVGGLIMLVAATALGQLAVQSVRDVAAAEQRVARTAAPPSAESAQAMPDEQQPAYPPTYPPEETAQ